MFAIAPAVYHKSRGALRSRPVFRESWSNYLTCFRACHRVGGLVSRALAVGHLDTSKSIHWTCNARTPVFLRRILPFAADKNRMLVQLEQASAVVHSQPDQDRNMRHLHIPASEVDLLNAVVLGHSDEEVARIVGQALCRGWRLAGLEVVAPHLGYSRGVGKSIAWVVAALYNLAGHAIDSIDLREDSRSQADTGHVVHLRVNVLGLKYCLGGCKGAQGHMRAGREMAAGALDILLLEESNDGEVDCR